MSKQKHDEKTLSEARKRSLKNLEKRKKFTSESGKAASSKSTQSKRRKKLLKDELLALLSAGDTQKKISVALIQEALKGNVKAFETIRDTIGQKPSEDVKIIEMPVINIKGL